MSVANHGIARSLDIAGVMIDESLCGRLRIDCHAGVVKDVYPHIGKSTTYDT